MRSFGVNIRGRVKNFPLPKNQPLVPVFEAVVRTFSKRQFIFLLNNDLKN